LNTKKKEERRKKKEEKEKKEKKEKERKNKFKKVPLDIPPRIIFPLERIEGKITRYCAATEAS